MFECFQITKEKRVKLESSIDSTQKQKPSKISEVDSISEKKFIFLLDWVYLGEVKESIVLYKERL
jgi:hypothetical protein